MLFAKPLAELIAELEKLPGVGPKSAQRLAYHLLRVPDHEAEKLASSILNAKQKLRFCVRCQNISESEECEICRDVRRDKTVVCVVGEPRDIVAIERINDYKGQYHVLHGLISPVDNIFPEQLRIRELLERFHHEPIEEVIVATNPTIEGDSTALYLAKLLKPVGLKVTRIAHGMPIGGELDYADSATLLSALEYRREM
ncbi:MAG: recombination protein RecR [Armatimonadetes bacterium]|nr:recombination protein RecR [Armatimonadota bacterium]